MADLYIVNLHLFKKKYNEKESSLDDMIDTKVGNAAAPVVDNRNDHSLELSKDEKEDWMNGITPDSFKTPTPPVYPVINNDLHNGLPSPDKFSEQSFGSISEDLIRKYLNSNYSDYMGSEGYKKLEDSYINRGQRAMEDTIGQLSARTGGMASSWAGTVGQEAYNRYLDDFDNAALGAYEAERNGLLGDINLALNQRDYEDKQAAQNREIATQKVLASIAAGEDPNLDDINGTGMGEDYWNNYIASATNVQQNDYTDLFSKAFDSDDPESYIRQNSSLTDSNASELYKQYKAWEENRKNATISNEQNGKGEYWVSKENGTIDGVTKGVYYTAQEIFELFNKGAIGIKYDPKTNTELYYLK